MGQTQEVEVFEPHEKTKRAIVEVGAEGPVYDEEALTEILLGLESYNLLEQIEDLDLVHLLDKMELLEIIEQWNVGDPVKDVTEASISSSQGEYSLLVEADGALHVYPLDHDAAQTILAAVMPEELGEVELKILEELSEHKKSGRRPRLRSEVRWPEIAI